MADSNSKYLLGTCYSCQKCLYCFQSLQENLCNCKKSVQPSRVKKPKRREQIYQRFYSPNLAFSKSNEFLFVANKKFDYNSNFDEPFSYTFCGTCNSQIQRLRSADRKTQKDKEVQPNKVDIVDISDDNTNDIGYNVEEEVEDEEEEVDSDLKEIKVQIIVKSKDIKSPTAKVLTIDPVSYNEIMETVNSVVKKTLKKSVKPEDYVISYKVLNARGPSSELEDESEYQEFISEYKKVFLAGKKMVLIVNVKESVTKKKNSTNKHPTESEYSSSEEQCTKRKKSCAIREEDLSRKERERAKVISTLYEVYKCDIHTTPCFI